MKIPHMLGGRAAVLAIVVAVLAVPAVSYLRDRSAEHQLAARGAELAHIYCATCHLEPDPDILPTRSWRAALGYMGYYLGKTNIAHMRDDPEFAQTNVASRYGAMQRDGVVPAQPLINDDDWDALRHYYLSRAPAVALPPTGKPALRWNLDLFEAVETDYRIPGAVTTLVRIRPRQQELYLGDSVSGILTVLDGDGRLKITARRYEPRISPIDIEFGDDVAYLASIGDLMAARSTDERPAHILGLPLANGSLAQAPAFPVLSGLPRLADFHMADLNGDGVPDYVVCGFGSIRGVVSWFASQPDGSYVESPLLMQPGCVRTLTHDFDDDGLLDVAVLVSDAREGFHIFRNRGNGQFEHRPVFETHPAYGHTYFELQDFNGDGLQDLLVVNGDNVDSDPYNTPKRYHGVRIYLDEGGLQFTERYFYPLQGAFIAKAADFDGDGDLDIAAISFYPDFRADRPESFVLLEQTGPFEFSPASLEAATAGRWLTMDVGDLDGDGDSDIVLGGGYLPVGMFGETELFERLRSTGPSILLLKNRSR